MHFIAHFRRLITVLLIVSAPAVVFAGGAREAEAPALEIPGQQRQYISPENRDGVQDVLQLPFSSVVTPAEDMVITEYNLGIFDGDGRLVSLTREVQDERRGFFGKLFGGEKPRVEIPESLTWDGTWNIPEDDLPQGVSNGEIVADGEYTYQLTVIDDAGNFSRSAPFAVTVDNAAPEVGDLTEPDYTVFSPNGDGVRDTISVALSGTREYIWVIEVRDASEEVVFTETLRNESFRRRDLDPAPPALFTWDGSTGTAEERAAIAPEGTYTIVLRGTDRAGNGAEARHPAPVELSLSASELVLRPSDGNAAFSPNGDGRRDALPLDIISSGDGTVRDWCIEVYNGAQSVRTVCGTGEPPTNWVFDGLRDDGSRIGDGTVQIVVTVTMRNGTTNRSETLDATIDTAAPRLAVSATTAPQETLQDQPLVFGAGQKERVVATIRYESDASWVCRVSLDGVPIFTGNAADAAEGLGLDRPIPGADGTSTIRLSWSGHAPDAPGAAADGLYELTLQAEDAAGNRLDSRPYRVLKDSRTPNVRLILDGEHLSPLSEGAFRDVAFRTEYGAADIIEEFLFEIINADDRVVRSEYKRNPFDRFDWNGLTNGGTVAADGTYRGRLRVIYRNGHAAESSATGPVRIDRTRPRINLLAAEPRRFSPDGDGEADAVRIVQDVVPGDDWTGRLVNEAGEVIFERIYTDSVESFSWDGRTEEGRVVPDGDYRYVLSSTDNAGNTTSDDALVTVGTRTVVAAPPKTRISLRPNPFSPDGDGVDDSVTIGISLDAETTIASWSARIVDHTGRVFKSFSGSGRPPRRIRWDGLSDAGELVESASDYPFELTLRDDEGAVFTESATIVTDILVFREGDDRLRIRVSSIRFAGNSADIFASDDDVLNRNLDTLRRLARMLNRYPDREIIVEGHAAHIYLENPAMRREQERVLVPLSRSRATEVIQALIILGVDRNRMTVEAYGGARPVVPHADRENLWKNRRVEFLLDREGGGR